VYGSTPVLNEREARDARATVADIDRALSSERLFEPIIAGLPIEVVNGYRRTLETRRTELHAFIEAYEAARNGDHSALMRYVGSDPGLSLIVARIVRGYSQKELALLLGMKEQQIQRYEADRYRSISLASYRRIAVTLGVKCEMRLPDEINRWLDSAPSAKPTFGMSVAKKIIEHGQQYEWFEGYTFDLDRDDIYDQLKRYLSDQTDDGNPTLLRTGLSVEDHSGDLLLIAWRVRVAELARRVIAGGSVEKRSGLDITWLRDLVRLSVYDDGPLRARDFLLSRGIVLIAEPQIPGLKLDGATFLVDDTPVIGMTLRRDTLDSFWYTLSHEVGHIILHYHNGLRSGFFDDLEDTSLDKIEQEANTFASNMLISDEKWKRSPARITKSAVVVEKLAKELDINPAIIFGRIQKERGDYAVFSNKVGRGLVRKWLLETL
jgi:HTH-type transcriptional regulator / antitoxin HigA